MPFVSSLAQRQRNKRWADKNREYIKSKNYQYNLDTEKRMFIRVKSRAKRLGIPFDITEKDIIIPEYCPILGIKLVVKNGMGKGYFPDSPSLDRIIPKLGYIKGNIRVISARANLLKSDATLEELEAILGDARAIHN